MNLLPYDAFSLQTTDPVSVVLERLAPQVEPEKPIRWGRSRHHAPYQGKLSETGFQICRIIHYRNSFLPLIQGRFEPLPSGTRVHITMRLHPFVMAFLVFWYFIWYGFFAPIWLTGAMPIEFSLQFLGLPIAILLAFWGAFWAEVYRSRRDLTLIILGSMAPRQAYNRFSQWIPNAVQWGVFLLGLTLGLLQITGHFSSVSQSESEPSEYPACSQHPVPSLDCNISLNRTLVGHLSASALAISDDGQLLVSGGTDKAIKVWDVKTGQLKKTLQSDSGQIRALAIAPDGKTIVSGSADHMVRIWNWTTNQRPRMLTGHAEEVNLVSITPDSKTVISGSYGAIKTWDLATGQLKATFPKVARSETRIGPITVINDDAERFNPLDINSASNIALIDELNIVDLKTNQIKPVPTDQVSNRFTDYFLSARISPDGKLAVLEFGNTFRKFETHLKVWDLTTGTLKGKASASFSHNTFEHVPLALSRDRIFGSTGKQLKVWDLQTAHLEAVIDTGWMSHLVVTPDGSTLAGLSSPSAINQFQIDIWQRQPK